MESPGGLWVRDSTTGRPVLVPLSEIPKELWPEKWYENPQWQYSGALQKEEVMALASLDKYEISPELAQKLAQYILDYAKHIVIMGWLFLPEKEAYLESMKETITKLSALRNKASNRKDVMAMVHVAQEVALDPF